MSKLDPEIIVHFRDALQSNNKQPATAESYSRDALDFLSFLDHHQISLEKTEPETLLWFRDHLREDAGEKENSIRRKVIGVRQFFRFLVERRILSSSPFEVVPLPERDDSFLNRLSRSQLEKILDSIPERGLKNLRDRAILHLLAYEGLKASELIQLSWRNISSSSGFEVLTIPGMRSRTIQMEEESAASLAAYGRSFATWLESEMKSETVDFPYIFLAFKGKDHPLVLPQMTRHGLKFMLSELGEKLGLKHLHTETLRHHAIVYQLSLGRRPEEVMQHLGLRRIGNIGRHLGHKQEQ